MSDEWTPRCASNGEFELLRSMADRACWEMQHRHGKLRHCAAGLVVAEKAWDDGVRSEDWLAAFLPAAASPSPTENPQ